MIHPEEFYNLLIAEKMDFFTGVPDSLLKDFCAYVEDHTISGKNVITANEGNAIAVAAGHHLATGKIGVVYMQNAGEGNAVNPLVSLTDSDVYGIPLLLLIGWRGEPGITDEPQHKKQGRITKELLDVLEIPYEILPDIPDGAARVVKKAAASIKETNTPYALIIKKGTFIPYSTKKESVSAFELSRERAIELVTDLISSKDIIISTTGKTSRELYEYRKKQGMNCGKDFLTVGSMGHASSIALGIALAKKDREIYCLDGDGAVIMHMGALAVIGTLSPRNFKHIVFNNGAHDSVGGQPTAGLRIDMTAIARACGYKTAFRTKTESATRGCIKELMGSDGPAFLEIQVKKGARGDLGRPSTSPLENKQAFTKFVRGNE